MTILRMLLAAAFCGAIVSTVWAQDPAPDAAAATSDDASPADALPTIPVETGPSAPAEAVPSESDPVMLDDVVVTAQKRAERITDIPISISAFNGESLRARGVTDTRDLSNLVPGFTVSHSGQNTPVYTLRGVGFNDTAYSATPTVGVYVDEVSLPYSFMTKGANLDLERVEVLKGPQGTLYGRNTTGGAINYIANRPTDDFAAGISGSFGRFATTDVEGFVSGALGDTLKGRFALKDLRSGEGWQYSNTRPDDRLGRKDQQAARGALEWEPHDALQLRLVLSGWRDHSEPQAPQAIAIRAQNSNGLGEVLLAPEVRDYPVIAPDSENPQVADWYSGYSDPFRNRDDFHQGALTTQWFVSDTMALTAIASHGRVASKHSFVPLSGLDSENLDSHYDASVASSNLEVRLAGSTGGTPISWMIGVNGGRDDAIEERTPQGINGTILYPIPGTGMSVIGGRGLFFLNGYTQAHSEAVFANAEWLLPAKFKLTTGARYTMEQRDYTGCTKSTPDNAGFYAVFNALSLSRGGDGVQAGECATEDEEGNNDPFTAALDEKNVAGRLALDWTGLDDVLLYVSFSRGFKSGSFPIHPASTKSQLEPVTQERLHAFELGAKSSLFGRAVQVNTALFHYDYKDKQLFTYFLDPTFGPLPILDNAPKSTVQGAELELLSRPLGALFLSAAASYIRTRVDEFVSTNSDGQPQDFSGRPFNFAPLLQYNLLADYTWGIADLYLTAGADYAFKDKTNSTLGGDPLFAHPAYGLLNARLRLSPTDARWAVMLVGHNLTNELATVGINRGTGDAVTRYTGPPMSWGVTFSRAFGE